MLDVYFFVISNLLIGDCLLSNKMNVIIKNIYDQNKQLVDIEMIWAFLQHKMHKLISQMLYLWNINKVQYLL